ncbi:NADH dehydrogenase [Natronoarchaeum philippinense]|uniref:NADH dehydrogenase n=1 Tax=Natronoarchaeum philippinense TaxID=558529 RepID=A0A285N398_NATPI|nr:FAD-dependent oxidoreductase [Natronoarchaeum philippinense]SNZ02466.1 NADH dehydrogenase [Natronoarchaeum philippinense]
MRVLVLGGGYAGLALTRRLEDRLPPDVELLLVDDTGEHLVLHELHRAIRRPSIVEAISIPLADVTYRADVRTGTVAEIDADERVVTLADGEQLEYDIGAVCLGAETADYGIPGVEEHGTPLKTVADAETIREEFLDVLERSGDRVVIGGAGLSGIQVAGELAALAREQLGDTDDGPELCLLEQKTSVAPGFDAEFQDAIENALRESGVDIRTESVVAGASEDAVELAAGERIECDQFVWTGGITGRTALDGERPVVRKTLRLADRTFVLGDAARVVDAEGRRVPASAQAAVREAAVVAESMVRLVEHDRRAAELFVPRPEPFRFDSPGWVVSVGDDAVAQIGPAVLTGRAAVAAKATTGASYLGSVGAVGRAVDLVYEELGPPPSE